MRVFLIFLVLAIASTYADTEFFNLPDLAFIPSGTYNVFDGAPNKNGKFDTIQGAIDQALCDGFTPQAGKIARIVIHQSCEPYVGEGPDNEIHVPSSVRLHGAYTGSIMDGPQIKATLVMTNAGSALSGFLENLPWVTSGLNFIQPAADKPVVKYDQDLTSFTHAPVFSDCYITSSFNNATSSMFEISNFVLFIWDRCWFFSASPEPIIRAKDSSSVEILNSLIVAYKLVVSEGVGGVVPATSFFMRNTDIAVEPGFLGNLNTDIVLIDMLSEGWERVFMFHNDIKTFRNDALVGDVVIFRADSSVTGAAVDFIENVYGMVAGASGTHILYDAPATTISSGTNSLVRGTISATNAIIVPAITV